MKEAIILAGGFGTRLRSVVSDVPKPLAPVAGRPFLAYVLDALVRQGYGHAVLATGYMHEKVEACFGRIIAFREKDPAAGAGNINGGIYRLQRQLLDGYAIGQQFSFEKDVMQQRYAEEAFYAYADGAYFIDIGVPEDYRRAQTELPAL